MKKEQLEKILLIALIFLGFLYAYYSFLLQPEIGSLEQTNAQLARAEINYVQLSNYAAHKSNLEQKIKEQEDLANKLNGELNSQISKPQVMVDLYSLAKTHTVDPQNLKFDALQDNGKYQTLGMLFTAQGKPADVLGMIQDLEKGSLKVTVQGINLVMQQGVMRSDLKLVEYSCKSEILDPNQIKPSFMNAKFGVDTVPHLFQQ